MESQIHHADDVMDYFCSAECYEKAVDAMLEPLYKKDATLADDPETIRQGEIWQELYPKDYVIKLLQDKYDSWKEDKDFKTRMARMDLKPQIDQKYWDAAQAAQKLKKEDEDREYRYQSDLLKIELKRIEEKTAYWVKWWERYDKDYVAAHHEHEHILSREEALREKEREQIQRQWEKDFEAAEKEHQKFLEAEAYEQALIFKPIPDHLRIHTGIIAKTGWGKTQLLQSLILGELKKRDPPSLIVLDSTGQMVDLIQHLAVFNDRLRDRILIIDPAHSPSLNMFDLSTPRFETYTREQKEDIQNEIVGLFNYVFSSEDYKLTGQMGIGFAYAVRLILSRPNSTMRDLRRLLEEDCRRCDDSAYAPDIANLDEDAQDFFRSHFYSDELKKTRAAIARRLQLMLSIPAFARMFITSRNALDLYGETQDKRSIILVNTNERLLKEGGYILFGRYIVARTMAAVLERASIPREQRTITHLIIDEGSPYMDETFDTLLTRVRQYGLKVTIAFQHFQQLTDKLKNSVAGQTSVKYAGGLSYQDARFLANDMRCEPDFLTSLKTDISAPPKWTQFAVYADNWNNNHSMLFSLPFFAMEREAKMTPDQYAALLAHNRQRTALVEQVVQKPQQPKQDVEQPSAPEQHKPVRKPDTPIQPLAKSAPTDPHAGDHTEPASKWGE